MLNKRPKKGSRGGHLGLSELNSTSCIDLDGFWGGSSGGHQGCHLGNLYIKMISSTSTIQRNPGHRFSRMTPIIGLLGSFFSEFFKLSYRVAISFLVLSLFFYFLCLFASQKLSQKLTTVSKTTQKPLF